MNAEDTTLIVNWHDALNGGDADRLVALSSASIAMVGPRGVATGEQVLRDWATRAGIALQVRRLFARDGTAVAEELAEWRDADTGAVTASQDVATIFRVADGRVAYVDRRPDLRDALDAAGLSEADEVYRAPNGR